jgi:branched-chain amino acid transport system permease protein
MVNHQPSKFRTSIENSGTFQSFFGAAVTAVILAGIVAVGIFAFGQGVVTTMLITMIAVIGLHVFSGNSGIMSFGHAGFVALGAYVSGVLTMSAEIKATVLPNLPWWLKDVELSLAVALLATTVVVGVVAMAIGYVFVRLGGYPAAIASLGVLVIVHSVLLGLPDLTRGAQTFYGIDRLSNLDMAFVIAVGAVVAARLFRGGRPGLQLRASREDELAARSFGANVRLRRLQAWTLAAVLAALSGALLAHFITAFSPKQFYFALTFSYIVMLVIGGPATVMGAIGGTVLVTVLNELLREAESGFQIGGITIGPIFGATQFILAGLMLVVMYFRRDGLFGLREPDEWLMVWLARRKTLREPTRPARSAEIT